MGRKTEEEKEKVFPHALLRTYLRLIHGIAV
jgi:hypothetical protein